MKKAMVWLLITGLVLLTACSSSDTEKDAYGEKASDPASQVTVKLDFVSEKPESNKKEPLVITAYDVDGNRITDYQDIHVDKLHLIVISRDLSVFQHVHPMLNDQGEFMIDLEFPKGGDYQLISTLSPEKMKDAKIVDKKWVTVEGEYVESPAPVPDEELTNVFEGKQVTLAFDELVAGHEVNMTYEVLHADSQKPVTDLESYIGSMSHVVMMSENSEHYIHVHPIDDTVTGPTLEFRPIFPEAGIYKIWGEIKHDGQVIVLLFTVQVNDA